jgi:FMN phosphatase YigB (HAD superfamily)/DNA-binding XRE family transcriptional regulator
MDEVGLGELLQEARKKAGLTQQELCQKANLSYSTLAKIERGAIKAPSIFTIQSIAAALGLSLTDLMGEFSQPGPKTAETPKKRSKNGVRFVYFDINGCLVRFYHRAFTKIAEDSGKPADVIETAFWHFNDDVCRGELPMDEFNRLLGGRFELPQFDWRVYYLEAIEPIREMDDLVAWANEHYYVGLLSNIMPGQIKEMLARGLIPNVDYAAIVDSSEAGSIKPEARIYELAQEKSHVAPEEILFVDDSRTNIMAAEKLGWKVLWFDDYNPEESVKRLRDSLEFET